MTTIEVLLVSGDLQAAVDLHPEWLQALEPPDRERFHRFKHVGARNQFLVGRALLAYALQSKSLKMSDLDRSQEKLSHSNLRFNISHVTQMVGIAYSDVALGFDIEDATRHSNIDLLARRQFTQGESEWMNAAEDAGAIRRRFFQIWTLKEAILKADGLGLRIDTKELKFNMNSGRFSHGLASRWTCYSTFDKDFALSLATLTSDSVDIQVRKGLPGNWQGLPLKWQRFDPT